MISVLNFKHFDRGAIKGFFDLRYYGLTIKSVRLMAGKDSSVPWIALPQNKGEKDGQVQYFDLMYLTPPEAEHVRRLVLADLVAQGHIQRPDAGVRPQEQGRHITPEGEDLSEYTGGQTDDIPF